MMILEQGLSNLGGGGDAAAEYSRGMLCSLCPPFFMKEGSSGMLWRSFRWFTSWNAPCLQSRDSTSSVLRDDRLQLLSNDLEGSMKSRAGAVKGLVHLSLGELKSVESLFDGVQDCNLEDNKDQMRNSFLSNGKFGGAEDLLTKALTMAEEHFGPKHPKVGAVLTCVATMFKHKAKMEALSAILIQEGLYRKAIGLLKAPDLDSEGGYADILCIQENRKGAGERMKNCAETAWKNRRLSLAQMLEFCEPSQAAVIDTQICRVI